jgi:hypothetical protein
MPGDVCANIRKGSKNKGAGVNTDSIDVFMDLVHLNIAEVNDDIQQLFDLVYNAHVGPSATICFPIPTTSHAWRRLCQHKEGL